MSHYARNNDRLQYIGRGLYDPAAVIPGIAPAYRRNASVRCRAARRSAMIRRRRFRMLRWMLFIAAAVIMLSLVLALFFGRKVNAESDTAVTYYKYFRCQEVREGDTLWSYAGEYRCIEQGQSRQSYIAEVMSINHMNDDRIQEGQKIVLPYYMTEYVE